MIVNNKHYRTIWFEDGKVKIINQPVLPHKFEIIEFNDYKETADAITTMKIRGAGAIGAAAGYAMLQLILIAPEDDSFEDYIIKHSEYVRDTRPTAQNLFYAIERMLKLVNENKSDIKSCKTKAIDEANAIADEDANMCEKIGEIGEKLIKDGAKVLTHCNAGWLAFVDWGSAISPVYKAKRNGKKVTVFVDETRPRLQGARLTAWELLNEEIEHYVIADTASGFIMKEKKVDMIIVGADRIARNGDVANKIGTSIKAICAKYLNIPFYVAAPLSTFDINTETGDQIEIEYRSDDEVKFFNGKGDNNIDRITVCPKESEVLNPAFDVTDANLITGIITPKGIIKPCKEEIDKLFQEN